MNKDYAVKCEIDHGELYLSITHNGHQWASVAIKDREWEIPLIISELQRHLTRHSSRRANLGTCCGVTIENNFKYCPVCGIPIPPAA